MIEVVIRSKTGVKYVETVNNTADKWFEHVTKLLTDSAVTGARFLTGRYFVIAIDQIESIKVIEDA